MQAWLAKNALQLIGLGILLVILGIAGFAAKGVYDDYKAGKLTIAQQDRTMTATGDIAAGIGTATQSAAADTRAVDSARVDYYHHYEDYRNANPAVAAVLDTPVPERMRQYAICVELALERSGGAEVGDTCYDRAPGDSGTGKEAESGRDVRPVAELQR